MSETAFNLVKGQKVDLTKGNPGLDEIAIGLGWNPNEGTGYAFDLDAFAIPQDSNKKGLDLIYFRNLKSSDGALEHMGDNLTGQGDGDDETIKVHLSKLPATTDRVSFGANIYDASSRGNQNFGQVRDAFIRIYNLATGEEILRYDLSEDSSTANGFVFGSLYRKDGEWKFEANSEAKNGDLNQIFATFN